MRKELIPETDTKHQSQLDQAASEGVITIPKDPKKTMSAKKPNTTKDPFTNPVIPAGTTAADQPIDDQSGSTNPNRIRNLAGFWASTPDDGKTYRKKRLQVDESLLVDLPPGADVLPLPTGVLRATDEPNANEKAEPIEIDSGHAKNIASLFQNQPRDAGGAKKPFRLDFDEEETSEAPSSVQNSEGSDSMRRPSSAKQRWRIKEIAGTFSSRSIDGGSSENNPETEAIRVKSEEQAMRETPAAQSGRAKGLAERWKQQQLQQLLEKEAELSEGEEGGRKTKPAWLVELESAKESDTVAVFENEPEVRDDVIRADDEQPDVISAKFTRSLRQMWTKSEQEAIKIKEEAKVDVAAKSKNVSERAVDAKEKDRSAPPASSLSNSVKENTSVADEKDNSELQAKSNIVSSNSKSLQPKTKKLSEVHSANESKDVASTTLVTAPPLAPSKTVSVQGPTNNPPVKICENIHEVERKKDEAKERQPAVKIVARIEENVAFDVDDDYYWDEGRAIILTGAALKHVPRKKSVHMLIDE